MKHIILMRLRNVNLIVKRINQVESQNIFDDKRVYGRLPNRTELGNIFLFQLMAMPSSVT
jgi:hypothetical protein